MLTSGTVSFRYDYRINGRRETLVIGQYGRDGISLAEAREELIAAKEREMAKISRYKQSLYQDWKDGEITQQDYRDMKADYERQIIRSYGCAGPAER